MNKRKLNTYKIKRRKSLLDKTYKKQHPNLEVKSITGNIDNMRRRLNRGISDLGSRRIHKSIIKDLVKKTPNYFSSNINDIPTIYLADLTTNNIFEFTKRKSSKDKKTS